MARVWFAMADLPTSLESLQLVALAVLVDALLSPQNPRLLHCRTAVSLSLYEAETMLFGLHTASLGTPTSKAWYPAENRHRPPPCGCGAAQELLPPTLSSIEREDPTACCGVQSVVSTGCMLSHDCESKRPNVCLWRKGPGCLGCCWFPPVCSPSGRPCLGFLVSQTTWDWVPVSPCQANVPEQGAQWTSLGAILKIS